MSYLTRRKFSLSVGKPAVASYGVILAGGLDSKSTLLLNVDHRLTLVADSIECMAGHLRYDKRGTASYDAEDDIDAAGGEPAATKG